MDSNSEETQKSCRRKSKNRSKLKKSKSSKKEIKKSKKKRKYSESSSTCSSSESEENIWVEKKPISLSTPSNTSGTEKLAKREEWMNLNDPFSYITCCETTKRKKDCEKVDKPSILDQPGQSSRELNPYWKGGGTGLPEKEKQKSGSRMDSTWLKKSLCRAKEQAKEEGRDLEEIAAERWGSLDIIKSMIKDAELKEHGTGKRFSQYDSYKSQKSKRDNIQFDDYVNTHKKKKEFLRPEDSNHGCSSRSYSNQKLYSRSEKWRKEKADKDNDFKNEQNKSKHKCKESQAIPEIKEKLEEIKNDVKIDGIMTEAEMNKLGAKIVKAEIMGDEELATKLKEQLKAARDKFKSTQISREGTEEKVILLTDKKGSQKKQKKKSIQTHVSGERVRYFADDDKYSLDEMFQREKRKMATNDDAMMAKYSKRNMDVDDSFEQQISRVESGSNQDERAAKLIIKEQQKVSKSVDNCSWCIDSDHMLKHLIVSMDSKICLTLPAHVSLVEGHCVLSPVQHVPCEVQIDEDVSERLMVYKTTLFKLFKEENKSPIFFEIYKNRHKYPHMQIQCIPLPDDISSMAPMYFKKAILESEIEWASNKKLVEIKQKEIRNVIPKGLPYFAVDFGQQYGFAHVIENEFMFPANFATEIIGGMLDLDHSLWRKPRKESFDQQRKKVIQFTELWRKYNPAKENLESH
ncbi:CWF19-like protein 2 [Prorops nasuta]|uniref:CWF19-like protein 2 n=1 Tax=Prorops nasuta TaxID=863751 RepID=UPI0034CE801C